MLCAPHWVGLSQSRQPTAGGRRGGRGGCPSQLTDRGGAAAAAAEAAVRILRLVEPRHHVQVHGLLTGLFKPKNRHPKAQYHFHLTVIHEILQAYLQVLRRLLLNLPLSTAELTAAPL